MAGDAFLDPKIWQAIAFVTVAAGTPALTSGRGFLSVADTGAGVVTMELAHPLDTDHCVILATPVLETFAAVTVTITDEDTLVVRTWDAAGAALDNVSYTIAVGRIGT